ncbi:MAG: hypothetical protein LBJ14_05130 [Desulfarculales bacterium]|nr:hypothetical protein [Desulfarculales bacterium]
MAKVVSAERAVAQIKDESIVGIGGFLGIGSAEELFLALEKRFLEQGRPRNLTLVHTGGVGDGASRGKNVLAHEGLIKRLIGGHFARVPKLGAMVEEELIECYNIPQGILSHLYRESAAGRPRLISKVGLNTFVDPDIEGARVNGISREVMVEKVSFDGEEYLAYKVPKVNAALLRGTSADALGNISLEHEPLTLEGISIASAARNNGGIVIVQVEKLVHEGSIAPQAVGIPHIMVDYVVVAQDKERHHRQNYGTYFDPRFTRRDIVSENLFAFAEPMGVRKVIARRAAMCMRPEFKTVNFGIGIPEAVCSVLQEEGLGDSYTPIIESGVIGGMALGDMNFGASISPDAIIDQTYMFDFIDGGGLDISFLGLAQCDPQGNINVSRFGKKVAGCGGFIDITQNVDHIVFCGTFTAGGFKAGIEDGKLRIIREGKIKKFVSSLQQITFSGKMARAAKKHITFVTERAVLELGDEGLTVTELAPGADLERDVLGQMEFPPLVRGDLKPMPEAVFRDPPMGLKIT